MVLSGTAVLGPDQSSKLLDSLPLSTHVAFASGIFNIDNDKKNRFFHRENQVCYYRGFEPETDSFRFEISGACIHFDVSKELILGCVPLKDGSILIRLMNNISILSFDCGTLFIEAYQCLTDTNSYKAKISKSSTSKIIFIGDKNRPIYYHNLLALVSAYSKEHKFGICVSTSNDEDFVGSQLISIGGAPELWAIVNSLGTRYEFEATRVARIKILECP